MTHRRPPYEDPAALRARLNLGREEFCQRLLTTLILGGHYPRWNSRLAPTASGQDFLRRLHELAGYDGWQPEPTFVDELDLPARTENERGGAPDWAVFWRDQMWIIELKTERLSHRPGQLQAYATLARHHYPDLEVRLTYLTPPLRRSVPPLDDGTPVGHLTWDQVTPLVTEIWSEDAEPGARRIAAHLGEVLGALDRPASEWRASVPISAAAVPAGQDLLVLAELTAGDGQQRAVEGLTEDLQGLHDLRIELRDQLAAAFDPQLGQVQPWVWSAATSGGQALTETGAETGFELRLSRSRS